MAADKDHVNNQLKKEAPPSKQNSSGLGLIQTNENPSNIDVKDYCD